MVVGQSNDVFNFFFQAGAGITLAAMIFGYLPWQLSKALMKLKRGGKKNVEKNVYQK